MIIGTCPIIGTLPSSHRKAFIAGLREIPQKEDLSCEFKSDLRRLPDDELIDAVVALSNTDGGVVYLGVEDDGTPTGIHETHADATGLSASYQICRAWPRSSLRGHLVDQFPRRYQDIS